MKAKKAKSFSTGLILERQLRDAILVLARDETDGNFAMMTRKLLREAIQARQALSSIQT